MSEIGLLPAYLIVGTDGVKRDHAVSRMKARLEKAGMVEFNLDERDMTKDPDIESIIGSLNTFPMGSEFRLVILDGCSKLAKAISEPLVEYLASPSPTTVCLIIADSLAKNTRLYKAIAKIDKKAVIDCFEHQALGATAPRAADGDTARQVDLGGGRRGACFALGRKHPHAR